MNTVLLKYSTIKPSCVNNLLITEPNTKNLDLHEEKKDYLQLPSPSKKIKSNFYSKR